MTGNHKNNHKVITTSLFQKTHKKYNLTIYHSSCFLGGQTESLPSYKDNYNIIMKIRINKTKHLNSKLLNKGYGVYRIEKFLGFYIILYEK